LCQQHRLKSQGLVKLGENVKRKNEDLQAEIKGANKDGCGGTQPPLLAPRLHDNPALKPQ